MTLVKIIERFYREYIICHDIDFGLWQFGIIIYFLFFVFRGRLTWLCLFVFFFLKMQVIGIVWSPDWYESRLKPGLSGYSLLWFMWEIMKAWTKLICGVEETVKMEWIQELFEILAFTRFYNKLDMGYVRKEKESNASDFWI